MTNTQIQADSSRWLADRAKPFNDTVLQTVPPKPPIMLSQGTPDLPTPRHAVEAVTEYLRSGRVYYTFHDGIPALREAIAGKLARENGLHYDPATEIIVTAGVQEAIFTTLMGIINPGDELIVADPHYFVYDQIVQMVGGKVVTVPVDKDAGFLLIPAAIEAAVTPRTKAILIITPDNPSGAVQPRHILEAVAEIATRHDLLVIADELYERFCFDGAEHVSIGTLPGMHERTITLNGFSKAYSMTGWRVGYLATPAGMKPALTTIKHATSICAAAPSQVAALAVLTGPQEPLEEMMTEWSARRTYLYDRLKTAGIPVIRTPGSYYVFIDISPTGLSDTEFAHQFAEEEGVRVGPGSGYGPGGAGHVRASFMLPIGELAEAIDRLESFWARRVGGP